MSEEIPSLGPCCYCGTLENVQNIIMVNKKSPIAGRGWGCVVCGLASDGASYVLCDDCFERQVKPKFACRGYPAEDGRIPYDELQGIHEHDMEKHRIFENGEIADKN